MKKRGYIDQSVRTTAISKPFRNVVIALVLITISIVWIPIGIMQHNSVVARSSSAIGSKMKFERSESEITLKNIYTDKNSDVLIARLGLSDEAQANLPYKGSDYKILIGSKSLKGVKEASVLFGKLSTDGDMFLMIPKPSPEDVYTIFIVNTKYVAGAKDGAGAESSKISQLDETINQSITNTLSAYDLDRKKDKSKVTTVKSDDLDAITFRLALKPGVDNEKYKPQVIDASLVENNEFKFETFFDEVFKKSTVESLQKDYANLVSQKKQIEVTRNEAADKLKINEFDKQAAQTKSKTETQLAEIDNKIAKTAKTLQQYEDLAYNDSMFANLNTKASVFDVDNYKKR